MKLKSIAILGILLFIFAADSAARAETRQLSWEAVTTYTDGTPIETSITVTYTAYWSIDPWLSPGTLRLLGSSSTATSASFDPAALGISEYETVYFTVKSVLSNGGESEYSKALPWNPPSTTVTDSTLVPMPPQNLGITNVATSTSLGTWKLYWDPPTKDINGNALDPNSFRYTLYWTTDEALPLTSLGTLGSSVTETSYEFDPQTLGINGNQRVFFTARAVLTTGEESALSDAISMRLWNKGPAAPKNGRAVRKNMKK